MILHAPDIKVKLTSAVATAEANLIWYSKHNQTISQWIMNELPDTDSDKDPNDSTTIGPLNVVFITLVTLISYFLSCY